MAGSDANNIQQIVEAGAEIIVAGSAVFGDGHPVESVKELLDKGTVWV